MYQNGGGNNNVARQQDAQCMFMSGMNLDSSDDDDIGADDIANFAFD